MGMVNKFAAPGRLREDDLLHRLRRVSADTMSLALTVASFNLSFDNLSFEGAENIADVTVRVVTVFRESPKAKGARLAWTPSN